MNGQSYFNLRGGNLKYLEGQIVPVVTSDLPSKITSNGICKITEVYWESEFGKRITSAVEGNKVYVVAQGNDACDGKSVSFNVLEDDVFTFNDKVSKYPDNSIFEGTIARSQWVVEYDITDSSSKYFFKAAVVGAQFISHSSGLLKVSRKTVEETPTTPAATEKTYEVVDGKVKLGGEPTNITIRGPLVYVIKGADIMKNVGTINSQRKITIIPERVQAAQVSQEIGNHLNKLNEKLISSDGKITNLDGSEFGVTEDDYGLPAGGIEGVVQ